MKTYFSNTTLLIFKRNQQFDYQVLALLQDYNDKFIEVIESRFYYELKADEENIFLEAFINSKIYNNGSLINDEDKKAALRSIMSAKEEKLKEHFLFLKKNKIFKFKIITDDEKKFEKELFAIIISILGAFLINIAILIFIKYKKIFNFSS